MKLLAPIPHVHDFRFAASHHGRDGSLYLMRCDCGAAFHTTRDNVPDSVCHNCKSRPSVRSRFSGLYCELCEPWALEELRLADKVKASERGRSWRVHWHFEDLLKNVRKELDARKPVQKKRVFTPEIVHAWVQLELPLFSESVHLQTTENYGT
jgi:hypothetical protein